MIHKRLHNFFCLLLLAGMLAAGCDKHKPATQTAPPQASKPQASSPSQPVVIQNCGRTLRFEHPPKRVIVTAQPAAELLIRLGVKSELIGVYYASSSPARDDVAAPLAKVPRLSIDAPPSKEVVLPLRPDFVLAQYATVDLNASRGGASREDYESIGAAVFGFAATSGDPAGTTYESFLSDVTDLGRIFQVEPAAERMVADFRARLAKVKAKVAGRPRVNVILCFSSNDQMLGVFGAGVLNDLIQAAGGQNVYGNEKDSMVSASREDFAIHPIDCYVLLNEPQIPDLSADKSAAWLFTTFPATAASKAKRYIGINSEKLNLGCHSIEAVEEMARAFHPEAFKEEAGHE